MPVVLLVAGLLLGGCGPGPARPVSRPVPSAAADVAGGDAILGGAVKILERLDEYAEDEANRQVAQRLAEWRRAQTAAADAAPDPLIGTLPERLRPPLEAAGSAADDLRGLRDACWLAGVARRVRGAVDDGDQLTVARELFRWTVRSLAIVSDPPTVPTATLPGSRWFMPGEILLAGRASAAQRAWVFLELLRQAGIDGVMLATGADGGLRPWLPAAIIDGEAYLFEPAYGMPVPGPGGVGIATARQAAADPAILQALSLPDRAYPLQAGDVGRLVPLVAADPWGLGGRSAAMAAAVMRLGGPRVGVDTAGLVNRARAALPGVGDTRGGLWEFPFETVARRRAEPARIQPALQAELAALSMPTLPSVVADYLARTPAAAEDGGDPDVAPFEAEVRREGPRFHRPLFAGRVREFRGDLTAAREAYMAARPSPREIDAVVATAPPAARDGVARMLERMREDAGYWLGVVLLDGGEDLPAADFLGRVTLAEHPQGRWTDAARVNLAEALVRLGRNDEAESLLRADESPQRFGSRLRANALRP